jgi:drug/metabolite transporter (DMT)-like permease
LAVKSVGVFNKSVAVQRPHPTLRFLMPSRRTVILAVLGTLFACLLWSGNFIIARGAHDWMPPIGFAFWRWVVAFVVLYALCCREMRAAWPRLLANARLLIPMGIVGVALFNTLVYVGARYTTAHHIALIATTAPVWTLLLAGCLGLETFTRGKVIGVAFALLGAVVILCHGSLAQLASMTLNKGDVLVLLGSFCWALYSLGVKKKPAGLGQLPFLTALVGVGVLALLPVYLYESLFIMPAPFTLRALGIYLYAGAAASAAAWLLWNHSIAVIGAMESTLLYYSMPVFTSILAILLLDEPFELYHIKGFALILLGILIGSGRLSNTAARALFPKKRGTHK